MIRSARVDRWVRRAAVRRVVLSKAVGLVVRGAAWGPAVRYCVDGAAVRVAAAGGRAVRGAGGRAVRGAAVAGIGRDAGTGGAGTGDIVTGAIDIGAIVTAGTSAPRIDRVTWTGAMLTRVDITGLIDTVRTTTVVAPRPYGDQESIGVPGGSGTG